MSTSSGKTLVHTGSHGGIYDVEVDNGRVVGVRAFARDPQPSRIIDTMPSAVHAIAGLYSRWYARAGWSTGSEATGRDAVSSHSSPCRETRRSTSSPRNSCG